jgi:ABC-type multidrug transport system permease subunit
MVRTVIGGLVGGVIIFVMGFIFWGSPIGTIPFSHASDPQAAAVQTALAQNLTRKDTATGKISGSGTYMIPDPRTREGAELYARGPVASVSYNTSGFAPDDMSMLLPGFILAVVTGLLMAFGLAAVGGGGRSFGNVARLVVFYTLGFTLWECLTNPVFMHADWRFWIYSFVVESISFILAGLVIARWFMPHYGPAATETPPATEA